jgi:hypothetical protein
LGNHPHSEQNGEFQGTGHGDVPLAMRDSGGESAKRADGGFKPTVYDTRWGSVNQAGLWSDCFDGSNIGDPTWHPTGRKYIFARWVS